MYIVHMHGCIHINAFSSGVLYPLPRQHNLVFILRQLSFRLFFLVATLIANHSYYLYNKPYFLVAPAKLLSDPKLSAASLLLSCAKSLDEGSPAALWRCLSLLSTIFPRAHNAARGQSIDETETKASALLVVLILLVYRII